MLTRITATAVMCLLVAGTMIAPASARDYKMTTPITPGVATPDTVETSIGTLKFNDGFPTAETTQKIYDIHNGHTTSSSGTAITATITSSGRPSFQ